MILALLTAAWVASACELAQDYDLPTQDGASVHLHRHPASGPPVLVVHGISSNHHCWDLSPDRSLAVALAQAGYDAWLLDLRGHGDARHDAAGRTQRSGWSVDDYGRYDLPAAIAFIQEHTGYPRLAYVGHSMGGMVFAVYNAWYGDDAFNTLVIVASPIDFSDPDPLLALGGRSMAAGTLLPRVQTPILARVAANMKRSPFKIDELLYSPQGITGAAREAMYRQVVSPLSRLELRQFARTVRQGQFTSMDGERDYLDALGAVDIPVLAIAGRADRVAPPDRLRPWVEGVGSARVEWVLAGVANGFSHDYGHLDLAVGDTASDEIYPRIVDWITDTTGSDALTIPAPATSPAAPAPDPPGSAGR